MMSIRSTIDISQTYFTHTQKRKNVEDTYNLIKFCVSIFFYCWWFINSLDMEVFVLNFSLTFSSPYHITVPSSSHLWRGSFL